MVASKRNLFLEEISDGLNNLGAAFGLGNTKHPVEMALSMPMVTFIRELVLWRDSCNKTKIQYYDKRVN